MCIHISVQVNEIVVEVREGFQTLVDRLAVEVPHYIPQSLIRVFEVLVTEYCKVWENEVESSSLEVVMVTK